MRYEYKTIRYTGTDLMNNNTMKNIDTILNNYSKEGWELVNSIKVDEYLILFILRKMI